MFVSCADAESPRKKRHFRLAPWHGDAQDGPIGPKRGAQDEGGISGQVDQGASSNKTMNLTETLAKYSDDGKLAYDSVSAAALGMKLGKIPTSDRTRGSRDGSGIIGQVDQDAESGS